MQLQFFFFFFIIFSALFLRILKFNVQLRWQSGKSVRLGSLDLCLILSRVKAMTLKLVFTASLLDCLH